MQTDSAKNERASFIRNSLENGKSREEIAKYLGYKTWRSLDIYMRRTGARWDSHEKTYVYKKNGHKDIKNIVENAPPKVASIITKLSAKDADPLQISKECGFQDHRELSSYMASNGYHWSVDMNNYIEAPIEPIVQQGRHEEEDEENKDLQKYLPFLQALYKNKDRLLDLSITNTAIGTMPRYTVPGITRTKSFYMSDRLARLIAEFSELRNISQKEIIEAAVIEFLRRYSFSNEVDIMLGKQ